jgi:hypothetical protein
MSRRSPRAATFHDLKQRKQGMLRQAVACRVGSLEKWASTAS